jgi:hypothetical protein
MPHDVDCATELRKLMGEQGEIAKAVRKVALEAVEASSYEDIVAAVPRGSEWKAEFVFAALGIIGHCDMCRK